MKLLDKLERKIDLPPINITYYLIGGQIFAFLLINFYPEYRSIFVLQGAQLYAGQWWRIVTFLFQPLSMNFIFIIFIWYLYYLYGTALERFWGTFRYMVYLLIAVIGTIIVSLIFPSAPLSNTYLYTSLFLAFAYLYPDFQLLLFFILPVKIKWLAVLAWIGIAGSVLFGDLPIRILALVSILNFILFFGEELFAMIRHKTFQTTKVAKTKVKSKKPQHVCNVCGKNEIDNPDMGIRYCTKCSPEKCFCEDHFLTHYHTSEKVVN